MPLSSHTSSVASARGQSKYTDGQKMETMMHLYEDIAAHQETSLGDIHSPWFIQTPSMELFQLSDLRIKTNMKWNLEIA
jgi:hypothetical protein